MVPYLRKVKKKKAKKFTRRAWITSTAISMSWQDAFVITSTDITTEVALNWFYRLKRIITIIASLKKNPTRSRNLNINKKWPKFQSLWNWVELIASKFPWFITRYKHPLVFPSNITIRFEVRITITCTTRAVSGKSAGRYKRQRRHRIKALFKKRFISVSWKV